MVSRAGAWALEIKTSKQNRLQPTGLRHIHLHAGAHRGINPRHSCQGHTQDLHAHGTTVNTTRHFRALHRMLHTQ